MNFRNQCCSILKKPDITLGFAISEAIQPEKTICTDHYNLCGGIIGLLILLVCIFIIAIFTRCLFKNIRLGHIRQTDNVA